MDALFIFRSLRQLFGRASNQDSRLGESGRAGRSSVFPPAAVEAPVVVKAQAAAPSPSRSPMRSLEEVRADLARLRLSARERHAKSQAWRDTNFAPTDFMELAKR